MCGTPLWRASQQRHEIPFMIAEERNCVELMIPERAVPARPPHVNLLRIVYDRAEMRRLLSLALLCVFGLAPFTVLLPGSEEASLPMCCRRNGAHHCAMAMEMAASHAQDTSPGFAAPRHCPRYSAQVRATTAPFLFPHFAFAHARAAHRLAAAPTDAAILARALTHSGRGPPRLS